MNINDLLKLDLKNIDLSKLQDLLFRSQESLAKVLIVLVAVIASFVVFKTNLSMTKRLETELTQWQQKSEAISAYQLSKDELDKFTKSFPNSINGEPLINQLTDFAVNRNLQIVSVSPVENKSSSDFEIASVFIDVQVKDYEDLILFTRDIERSSYSLRIDTCSVSVDADNRRNRRSAIAPGDALSIKAKFEISSIILK